MNTATGLAQPNNTSSRQHLTHSKATFIPPGHQFWLREHTLNNCQTGLDEKTSMLCFGHQAA